MTSGSRDSGPPCTIQLTADQAEALYQWLESEDNPVDYWRGEGAVLGPLQAALSAWRKYESPL